MPTQDKFPAQRLFAVVSTSAFTIIALSTMSTTAIAPVIGRELHGTQYFPLIFGLSAGMQVISTVLAGVWVDARGAKPSLLVGTCALLASLLGAGLAPNIATFLLARALDGIANGLVLVPLYVLAATLVHPNRRADMFALFSAAWVLPSLVGPVLAGFASQAWGWRATYLALGIIFLPVLLFATRLFSHIENAHQEVPKAIRNRSMWAVIAGGAVVILQLSSALTGMARLLAMVAGIVLAIIGIGKVLPAGTLWAAGSIPAWVGARGLFNGSFITLEVFIPLMLQNTRGYSVGASGLALVLGSATWAAGSFLGGRSFARPRLATLPVAGAIVLAVGIALTSTAAWPNLPAWLFLFGWVIAGTGMGMAFAPLSVLVLGKAPKEEQGLQSANIQVADSLGMALIMGIVASLMSVFTSSYGPAPYLPALGVAFFCTLLAALSSWRGQRHSRRT